MIRDMIVRMLQSLLPLYVNGRVSPVGRLIVEAWLYRSAEARSQADALRRLQGVVRSGADIEPPVRWPALDTASVRQAPASGWTLGWALIAILFIFTWIALPPAVELQWSVEGNAPAAFRVYRAPDMDRDGFELVEEIPAGQIGEAYRFRDIQILPGQEYVYRIEAVNQDGRAVADQVVMGDASLALPGQLALILTAIIAVYGAFAHLASRQPSANLPFLPSF